MSPPVCCSIVIMIPFLKVTNLKYCANLIQGLFWVVLVILSEDLPFPPKEFYRVTFRAIVQSLFEKSQSLVGLLLIE